MGIINYRNAVCRYRISSDDKFIIASIYDIDNRLCFIETLINCEKSMSFLDEKTNQISKSFNC